MAKATTSKTESLTVRVPVALMTELRAEASEHNQSLASVVVNRLWRVPILAARIADLEQQLARALRPPIPAKLALALGRRAEEVAGEQYMEARNRARLPAVNTDFPARPVYQRGQGPGKNKRTTNSGADNGQ